MEKRFADSAKIMHDYIWENTIRNWLRIVFFQWKRGLLLLRSRYSMGKHNGRELVFSMEQRFADSAKIMHDYIYMGKHNSQLVANWFFPMETRFAASA